LSNSAISAHNPLCPRKFGHPRILEVEVKLVILLLFFARSWEGEAVVASKMRRSGSRALAGVDFDSIKKQLDSDDTAGRVVLSDMLGGKDVVEG
jgi:hypothetical protein